MGSRIIDQHLPQFQQYASQARTIASRMRKEGFDHANYGGSLVKTIEAYNKHILSQIDPEALPTIRYLPDGRVSRWARMAKKGSQPWVKREREQRLKKTFHSRFWIHSRGRYPDQPWAEYFPCFIDPDTGKKRRGSILAGSQELMRKALKRYGQEHLDGQDALQVLLEQLFSDALAGDRFSRAEILCRILPVPRDSTLTLMENFDPDRMDAKELMAALVGQLATGQVNPTDARTAMGTLEGVFRVEAFTKLEERLNAIEASRVISHQTAEQSRQCAEDSGLLVGVDDEPTEQA